MYEDKREDWHGELFKAHHEMVKAMERLHTVASSLYAGGKYEAERRKLVPVMAKIEEARNHIQSALRVAGDGRTDLIGLTGCNGQCTNQ